MLIDLRLIDHDEVVRRQERNRVRFRLAKKTAKQLREFARDNHIPLYGAANKQDMLSEIMAEYGRSWKMKEEDIG